MLHVDMPTAADLHALATERHPAAVSFFLPTTPVGGEISGDRTVLKNLLGEAMAQLERAGTPKRDCEQLDALIHDIVEDDDFWRFQANSLALYATPDGVRSFRVPNALVPLVEVSDRFHLKPLLRAVTFGHHGLLLALAENSVALHAVTADSPAAEVHVADLPHSATDALGRSSMGTKTESRRGDTSGGTRRSLGQFCRAVDRALRPYLAGRQVPLFLVADTALAALYRQVNSYPHLAPFGHDSTPETLSASDLSGLARTLLDRLHAEEVAAIRADYANRQGNGRATADVAQAARAATQGAIQTLLVNMDEVVPGTVDEETGAVHFGEADTAATYGVVDEVARRALLSGARVLAVRAADLPEGAPLAAILRWAV